MIVSDQKTNLHEAPPESTVRLRGQVVSGGAPCVQFLTSQGQQISLEGVSSRDYPVGSQFEITGNFVAISRCMQGAGFNIATKTELADPSEL